MSTLIKDDKAHLDAAWNFRASFEELAGEDWDEDHALFTLTCREGRDAAAYILALAWAQELLSVRALRSNIGWAWSGPEYPLNELAEDEWRELFEVAGYTHNGRRRARRTRPTRLYRGATEDGAKGWSWTTNVETAKMFAFNGIRGRRAGSVWTVMAPPEAILAVITNQRETEDEFVCEPLLLPQPTLFSSGVGGRDVVREQK